MHTWLKRLLLPLAVVVIAPLADSGHSYARGAEILTPQGDTLAAGDNHFVAVKNDGTVWAWGAGAKGQLGGKNSENAAKPLQSAGIPQAVAAAAGRTHSIAVKADGSVWLWGSFDGQSYATPTRIPELAGVAALAEGKDHVLALMKNGTVRAWGGNGRGQLGNGSTVHLQLKDAAPIPGLTDIVAIAAGDYHSAALGKDGFVWTWGGGGAGQLGSGDYTDSSVPVRVPGLGRAVAITAGAFHTAALLDDGTVQAWGYNAHGELGSGKDEPSPKPLQVTVLQNIAQIAAGRYHMVALGRDGTVWTWGANTYGQIGTNANSNSLKPVQVSALGSAIAVVAGEYDAAALLADGTVKTWGFGAFGQLGDNTNQMRTAPVSVQGMDGAVKPAGPGRVIEVTIDGARQTYDQPPVLMNESTMVPLRAIFEALGAAVSWNNDERSVTATRAGSTVYLRIGQSTALVNGKPATLDQPAVIVNEHTMVPLRFVGEALGATVTWINETRTVAVTTK